MNKNQRQKKKRRLKMLRRKLFNPKELHPFAVKIRVRHGWI